MMDMALRPLFIAFLALTYAMGIISCQARETLLEDYPGGQLVFSLDPSERTFLEEVNWSSGNMVTIDGRNLGHQPPVYVGNLDTGEMHKVATDGIGSVLSPDSSHLVLTNRQTEKINVLRVNGISSELDRVLPYEGVNRATWSPDGMYLAILHKENISPKAQIWLFNLSQQNSEVLYEIEDVAIAGIGEIAWSPNGKLIAFSLLRHTGKEDRTQGDIYVLSIQDRISTNLTNSPLRHEDHPSWAPDSERLAFVSTPVDRPSIGQLAFGNVDGSCTKVLSSPEGLVDASWSPDGSQIVIAGGHGIYLLEVDVLDVEFIGSQVVCS